MLTFCGQDLGKSKWEKKKAPKENVRPFGIIPLNKLRN